MSVEKDYLQMKTLGMLKSNKELRNKWIRNNPSKLEMRLRCEDNVNRTKSWAKVELQNGKIILVHCFSNRITDIPMKADFI